MNGSLVQLAMVAVFMWLSCPAWAQEDETYEFDGVADMDPQPEDPTDWMTSVNWGDGDFDPLPACCPPIPDLGTRVEIHTSNFGVDAPVIGPGDVAEAYGVRIGRFQGEGLLTMTGGTLDIANSCTALPFTCDRRLRVGAADVAVAENRFPGTFNLSDGTVTTDTLWIGSGSHGEMNMSGGIVNTRGNFYFDWTFDAGSMLNMTGGTINVGDVLRMYRTSVLNLDGGEILVDGAAELGTTTNAPPMAVQTPNITVAITGGLLQSNDFLQIGGSVVLDGGILRGGSFNETTSAGTVQINEGGMLQFNSAQESIADVESLISSGFLTTSSPLGTDGFVIEIVDVDGTTFTQVALPTMSGGVPGDYNGDSVVDAADYTLFRDNLATNFTLMNENPAAGTAGVVDQEDYDFWIANYGNTVDMSSGSPVGNTAVPEPASLSYGLLTLAAATFLHRRLRLSTMHDYCSNSR